MDQDRQALNCMAKCKATNVNVWAVKEKVFRATRENPAYDMVLAACTSEDWETQLALLISRDGLIEVYKAFAKASLKLGLLYVLNNRLLNSEIAMLSVGVPTGRFVIRTVLELNRSNGTAVQCIHSEP